MNQMIGLIVCVFLLFALMVTILFGYKTENTVEPRIKLKVDNKGESKVIFVDANYENLIPEEDHKSSSPIDFINTEQS